MNSIDDIISLHLSDGKIEDAYQRVSFDNKTFVINRYNLRVSRGNLTKEEARRWNLIINNEVKKDRNLYKEIREFNSVFQLFNRLGIKSGDIVKNESPDFIFIRNNITTGIEITKIYVGNDWIAEKISEEIKAFKKRKKEIDEYDRYVKFRSKIITFQVREGTVITQSGNEQVSDEEYIVEIKNKIFEKIRKMMDEYDRYDRNVIFVEIVSPLYLTSDEDIKKLNDEMSYYISHLDGFVDNKEYGIVLKTTSDWFFFDLTNGEYEII